MATFDLSVINEEFQKLLRKHEDDTDVTGKSREEFLKVMTEYDEFRKKGVLDNEDFGNTQKFRAMACNAYDELCENHAGLREAYGWWYGAQFVGYDNKYDLYIGTGDEY